MVLLLKLVVLPRKLVFLPLTLAVLSQKLVVLPLTLVVFPLKVATLLLRLLALPLGREKLMEDSMQQAWILHSLSLSLAAYSASLAT